MNDYYVEFFIKRDVENEKKKRKIIMLVTMAILFGLGIAIKSQFLLCLFVLSILGYYFLVQKYFVEFEYFYMDGELTISKIYNKAKRKKVLVLKDRMIKLIAPMGSAELNGCRDSKKIDFTANDPLMLPYVIICEHNGETKYVNIQMNDELYKELKRNNPNKVKKY